MDQGIDIEATISFGAVKREEREKEELEPGE